jgi:hypothetical protein
MVPSQKVQAFISVVLEAALYAYPRGNGISLPELIEVAQNHGFREGEVSDAARRWQATSQDGKRLTIDEHDAIELAIHFSPNPFCPIEVFDFVFDQFHELAREVGHSRAQMDRNVLVSRGVKKGYDDQHVDIAIACYIEGKRLLRDKDGVISPSQHMFNSRPSDSLGHSHQVVEGKRFEAIRDVLPAVKDVIARRGDGRPSFANPIRAFGSLIPRLGYDVFFQWWEQVRGELERTNRRVAPTTTVVLAASLAEAAFVFVAKEVRSTGLSMQSKEMEKPPRQWSLNSLIKAAKGGQAPLLDDDLGRRCERLNILRQRIHIGRFMKETTTPPSVDIRPEEAAEGVETLERLLRALLDWQGAHLKLDT